MEASGKQVSDMQAFGKINPQELRRSALPEASMPLACLPEACMRAACPE